MIVHLLVLVFIAHTVAGLYFQLELCALRWARFLFFLLAQGNCSLLYMQLVGGADSSAVEVMLTFFFFFFEKRLN